MDSLQSNEDSTVVPCEHKKLDFNYMKLTKKHYLLYKLLQSPKDMVKTLYKTININISAYMSAKIWHNHHR